MIKRLRQNKSARPSNRPKFKGDNRKTIYAGAKHSDRVNFKKFPKSEVAAAVQKIRDQAKINRRNELILFAFIGILVSAFIIYSIYPTEVNNIKPTPQDTRVDHTIIIEASGDRIKPLPIENSSILYSLLINGYQDSTLKFNYEIHPPNMVGKDVRNIEFFDKDTVKIGRLLDQDGSVRIMWGNTGYLVKTEEEKGYARLLFLLAKEDSDSNNRINSHDKHQLYLSEVDGSQLRFITDRELRSIDWANSGRELLLEYYSRNKAMENFPRRADNDTLYGCFDLKSGLLYNSIEPTYRN